MVIYVPPPVDMGDMAAMAGAGARRAINACVAAIANSYVRTRFLVN